MYVGTEGWSELIAYEPLAPAGDTSQASSEPAAGDAEQPAERAAAVSDLARRNRSGVLQSPRHAVNRRGGNTATRC